MSFENDAEDYLNKILDEMKQHFNQSENMEAIDAGKAVAMSTTETNISGGEQLQVNDEVDKEHITFKESENVAESVVNCEDKSEVEQADANCISEDSVPRDKESPIVKIKRPSRFNDDKLDEGIGKRSSRRRSKECNESILQSAIARKEKSYNEANKPQRLTRRLKPTQKVLENIAFARQEKLQDSTSNITRRNIFKSGKGKRIKTEVSDADSDSGESFCQEYDFSPGKRRSQRLSRSKEDSNMDVSESSNKSSNTDDPIKENSDDPESSSNGANLVATRVCLCTQNTTFFMNCKENASDSVHPNFKLGDFSNGTVLHFAANRGLLSFVHLLVLGQAELDALDKDQNTALMLAVSEGRNDVVQYLVAAGASITLKGTDGMTSLHLAAKCGNLQACKILLQSASLIKNYINVQDDGGWTPLVWACENGFVDVAKYLILKGADPLLRDVEHNVALHWSAFSGSIHITELLLDLGSDVNVVNAHGDTPLHISARENRYSCIVVLLSRGADISVANKNNETPLDCAPEDGDCYNIIALNVRLQPEGGWMPEKRKTILSNDISRGRELNPIQCINEFSDEPEPRDYIYITKNGISSDSISIDTRLSTIRSCKCEHRCVCNECSCGEMSIKCWYDEEGKLLSNFNFTDSPLIFECNESCMCNSITCTNRVVQKGLTQRFQLYKTETKGWGIKTLRLIPKGSFVCEYIGEILTDVDADQREDDSYLFDLDNRETESFCIDARKYGNFARFINHSCDPNLHSVKVFIDHQDLRFPRIALFAQREILANEELSFDYGHKFWLVKYKCFTCDCQAVDCKYSQDTIHEAIEKYNMLMEKNA